VRLSTGGLNDSTNWENWEYGVTKSGKVIDWNRCIYMEVAELINPTLGNTGKI